MLVLVWHASQSKQASCKYIHINATSIPYALELVRDGLEPFGFGGALTTE